MLVVSHELPQLGSVSDVVMAGRRGQTRREQIQIINTQFTVRSPRLRGLVEMSQKVADQNILVVVVLDAQANLVAVSPRADFVRAPVSVAR